jgi:hypothetical protein
MYCVMSVLWHQGGIARNRRQRGAAEQSGVIDAARMPVCKARAALDGENALIR